MCKIASIAVQYLEEAGASPELIMRAVEEMTAASLEKKEPSEFPVFWKHFPTQRKGSRSKALTAYRAAIKRDSEASIIKGLMGYLRSDEVARGFAKGAAAWLNDDRWTIDYTRTPDNGRLSFNDAARHLLGEGQEEGSRHTPESGGMLPAPTYDAGATGYAGQGILPRPEEL